MLAEHQLSAYLNAVAVQNFVMLTACADGTTSG